MGKETLIRSTYASSLAWDENQESQVDRVAAIGMAGRGNELGSAMLRVEALDPVAMRQVVLIVIRRLVHVHRITRGAGERIALAAVREIMLPWCPQCGGRGELHNEGEAVISCQQCSGIGLHRFSNRERAELAGAHNPKIYEAALCHVRDAVGQIVRRAGWALEGGE